MGKLKKSTVKFLRSASKKSTNATNTGPVKKVSSKANKSKKIKINKDDILEDMVVEKAINIKGDLLTKTKSSKKSNTIGK